MPPASAGAKRAWALSTYVRYVRPFKINEVGSEMAKENCDLDGVLNVGAADVKSIEGSRGNAMGIEDFTGSGPRSQRELEGMKVLAPGGKWNDALLHTRN